MLNTYAKNIIIKALRIRKERNENPVKILESYKNLSEAEKAEILKELE